MSLVQRVRSRRCLRSSRLSWLTATVKGRMSSAVALILFMALVLLVLLVPLVPLVLLVLLVLLMAKPPFRRGWFPRSSRARRLADSGDLANLRRFQAGSPAPKVPR